MLTRIKAPFVANSTLAAVSAIFSYGVREEHVEVNPCRSISKPHAAKSRERVASDDEIRRLWVTLTDMGTVESAVLKICLLIGQRSIEVICMRWQDVEKMGPY
jgi:site-specific recombinase XerC